MATDIKPAPYARAPARELYDYGSEVRHAIGWQVTRCAPAVGWHVIASEAKPRETMRNDISVLRSPLRQCSQPCSQGAYARQDNHLTQARRYTRAPARVISMTMAQVRLPREIRGARPMTIDRLPAYAVIIRAIWSRGTEQQAALVELARRGLWLSPEQRAQAGLVP